MKKKAIITACILLVFVASLVTFQFTLAQKTEDNEPPPEKQWPLPRPIPAPGEWPPYPPGYTPRLDDDKPILPPKPPIPREEWPYVPRPTSVPLPVLVDTDAKIGKPQYLPGEEIDIHLSFKNVSSETLLLLDFPPLIAIWEAGTYSSSGYGVTWFSLPGKTTLSIQPGEVIVHTLKWDQRDNAGRQVASGRYYLSMEHLAYQQTSSGRVGTTSRSFGEPAVLTIK